MYTDEEKRAISKFLTDEERMCDNTHCTDCELTEFCKSAIGCREENDKFEALKVISEWADKHPIKTNYEVMREKIGDFAINNMEIRNINDMADLISRRFHYTRCGYCEKVFLCDNTSSVDNCKEWIAEWLGQEAEE